MDFKNLFKQHGLTILCGVAVVALFLPFLSVNAEMEVMGASSSSSSSITGFGAMSRAFLGWGLLLGPVLLVAMNYVKQLEKHKGLLAIAVPAVCLVIEIITFFMAKSADVSASGGGGLVSADVSASVGIGFIILFVVYVAMIVAGAVLYHNYTLDKAGLERLKNEGAGLVGKASDKIKEIKK